MWRRWWCVAVVVVFVVNSSWCEDDEEVAEEEEEGPSTPRPPPPIPLKNLTELVQMYGYKAEMFEVTAPDGQNLGIFHLMPKVAGGLVVILQHGIGMAPDAWCLFNDSLAYLLTDSGADVWLPSSRGNVYSRKHQKYNPDKDKEFWDFSIDDMANIDLPRTVDFILEKTKKPNLYYIGYSLGTTTALIGLSQKPEYNAKIKEAILIAPIWHCTKYQFMVNKESSIYQMVLDTYKQWDDKEKWEAFPRVDVGVTDHQMRCNDLPEMATPYCEMGLDMSYSVVGQYLPAGVGVKVIKHIGMAYVNGKVMPWDYENADLNRQKYNQDPPPEYDLKKVTTKVSLFWSQGDQLMESADVEKLASELPNLGIKNIITDESFNHPDFLMPSTPELAPRTAEVKQKLIAIVKA